MLLRPTGLTLLYKFYMDIIRPNWPAPSNIIAGVTLRTGGVSSPPYNGLNLALHVGDQQDNVKKNRALLTQYCKEHCKVKNDPPNSSLQWHWLNQTHSTRIVEVDSKPSSTLPDADACWTQNTQTVCSIMTADCLPLLICSSDGKVVSAVHAGWKGLANGIIKNCIHSLCLQTNNGNRAKPEKLLAWLGPAISPNCFEVGDDVRSVFLKQYSHEPNYFSECEKAFLPKPKNNTSGKNTYMANIYQLATIALHQSGVRRIYGGDLCTASDPERFFSYRRDGKTGRMASFIYIQG